MRDDAAHWKEKYLKSIEQQDRLERRWNTRLDLYSLAAFLAVICRTDHSPSGALSRCGIPARVRSRSTSITGAAHLLRALRPRLALAAPGGRRGRLERGM